MVGRTTFVIAHRLSTVRRADLVLLLERGRLADQGSHDELMARSALYRDLYRRQLLPQEEAVAAELPPRAGRAGWLWRKGRPG
jgi:subfamily B ATP-binding cassette protein MsbA